MKIEKSASIRLSYSYDATGISHPPEGVILSETTDEVREAVLYCRRNGFHLIPRGAGTGFVGGTVPVDRSLILSTEKMASILDIDQSNMVALVEAGVITGKLQKAAESFGLMYPPDPSSLETCTIGGNIATNAGGPRAVKYGVTADYIMGLEVVLGTGEIYRDLEPVKKKVVGLNLTPLFVGSEGTLGIITKALLKLIPLPEARISMLIAFNKIEDAGRAVLDLIKLTPKPSAVEIMDTTSITCVKKYGGITLPEKVEAVLLVEFDGKSEELKKATADAEKAALSYRAQIDVAKGKKDQNRIWAIRRAISPSLMHIAPTKINEDITVPVSKLPEALKGFQKISKRYNIPIVSFGHAGDGNIHVNIMTDKNDSHLWQRALEATREVFMLTVSLGGVLSGEHGIGITKKPYLGIQLNPLQRTLYRRIKQALDPDNILNPGKKF